MSVSVELKHIFDNVGEGPHWDEKTKLLYCVDIGRGNVLTYNTLSRELSKMHFEGDVGAVIPRESGGLMVCNNKDVVYVDKEGNRDVMVSVDAGKQTRLNDAKCDPAGRLWAGTMGHYPRTEETSWAGSLYRIDLDGKVTKQVTPVDISNGLAWTADNKTMYYIDSLPRKVFAFDYDFQTGDIANQRTVVDYESLGPVETHGNPDGMCIDTNGNLWVACFKGGRVLNFDPRTGKCLREVMIDGAKNITSCCFGGENLDVLYVTSANMPPPNIRDNPELKQPLAGSLFKVTGLGVKGAPVPIFKG